MLHKMANETWPQGPSKKIQSIMDWLSDAQKDEMLILLQQDKEIREKQKKYVNKKWGPTEILPWTLHAEDVRGKLIKFLNAHWFKKVDSNGHEKYRNDKNVTVEVPHQHRYFALLDKIVKDAGYTKKDYINRKNRGKKGNRKNKENRCS